MREPRTLRLQRIQGHVVLLVHWVRYRIGFQLMNARLKASHSILQLLSAGLNIGEFTVFVLRKADTRAANWSKLELRQ